MIFLLILFIKRDHVESHACHHVLTPGGRCAGGPIGVGCAVSTSLSVEPSGKLLTVGRNVRPSSNSLIWNESSRSQTLCMSDVISGHILRHKKRPLRMHQRTFLYLWFNGIYSAVHVSETAAVHTLCMKERQTRTSSVPSLQQAALFLCLHLSFPVSLLLPRLFSPWFLFHPTNISSFSLLHTTDQAKMHKNNICQTRHICIRYSSLNHVAHR